MSHPFNIGDGYFLDDYDHLITSKFIDLRDPKDRLPIGTLIKGCRQEHALENGNTIRISKPEKFRTDGDDLISDLSEMYFSSPEQSEVVYDPNDLAEARLRDVELNRAAEVLQTGSTTTTNSIKKTLTSSQRLSFGKNGWMYCTSMDPLDQEGLDRWWIALNDSRADSEKYNHISYIHRPREFLRALGTMVTEQLGPHGREVSLDHTLQHVLEGEINSKTIHRSQMIFHGPVVYVDDPYGKVANASTLFEKILLAIFVKSKEYQDQREYRFAIWTEEEPEGNYVDLNISPEMLGSLRERTFASIRQIDMNVPDLERKPDPIITQEDRVGEATTEKTPESSASQAGKRINRTLLDVATDPSTPIVPYSYDVMDLPEDLYEKTVTYSAVRALTTAVDGFSGKRRTEIASSAWHAEPCIRRLCARFEDPIKSIAVSDDNYVDVVIKFPQGSRVKARILFGPLGTSSYKIERGWVNPDRGKEKLWQQYLPCQSFVSALEQAGLPVRPKNSPANSESTAEPSVAPI